jgi:hypothetical protein
MQQHFVFESEFSSAREEVNRVTWQTQAVKGLHLLQCTLKLAAMYSAAPAPLLALLMVRYVTTTKPAHTLPCQCVGGRPNSMYKTPSNTAMFTRQTATAA